MEQLGIKTIISAFSGTNLEIISYYMGEPAAFSYVPTVAASSDKLSMMQKVGNLIGGYIGFYMFNTIAKTEGKYLKAKFGDKYSGHGVGIMPMWSNL